MADGDFAVSQLSGRKLDHPLMSKCFYNPKALVPAPTGQSSTSEVVLHQHDLRSLSIDHLKTIEPRPKEFGGHCRLGELEGCRQRDKVLMCRAPQARRLSDLLGTSNNQGSLFGRGTAEDGALMTRRTKT